MKDVTNYMLPCLNKQVLGFECPGCGIQRSFILLSHGEVKAAFIMYPAIYTLIFLFGVIILSYFYKFKHASKLISILAIISVALILINFFYKLIN